jgi:hypothetical protein
VLAHSEPFFGPDHPGPGHYSASELSLGRAAFRYIGSREELHVRLVVEEMIRSRWGVT